MRTSRGEFDSDAGTPLFLKPTRLRIESVLIRRESSIAVRGEAAAIRCLDQILDEIDSLLEENAEEFVGLGQTVTVTASGR